MKKIGHESIDSYKMLKFNTFSFFTPRKFFFPLCYLCKNYVVLYMLQGVQCVALVRQTSLYIFALLCMYMEI